MSKLIALFTFAISAIGEDKVSELMTELGYDEKPTAKLCIRALNECGKDFAVPFGKMIKAAAKKPATKALLKKAANLKKGSGQTQNNLTAEQKSQIGLNWFNAAGGFLTNGASSAAELTNALNGTDKTNAQAQYNTSQALLMSQMSNEKDKEERKTLYWILGGVGVLMLIMILMIALTKRS